MDWLTETESGVEMTVRVVPRASRTEIAGREQEWLRIRLQSPPVDGKANQALCLFLAKLLGVPRRAVKLVAGETSRNKRLAVEGITRAAAAAKIGSS